jgi:hypothetical protein
MGARVKPLQRSSELIMPACRGGVRELSRRAAAARAGARRNDCFTAYPREGRTLARAAVAGKRDWAPVIFLYFQVRLPF